MNDTGLMGVQIIQALQNLARPFLDGLHRDVLVLLPVLPQIPRSADLGDEVERVMFLVLPHMEQSDDVLVLQASQQPDLRTEAVDHRPIVAEIPELHLVPTSTPLLFPPPGRRLCTLSSRRRSPGARSSDRTGRSDPPPRTPQSPR